MLVNSPTQTISIPLEKQPKALKLLEVFVSNKKGPSVQTPADYRFAQLHLSRGHPWKIFYKKTTFKDEGSQAISSRGIDREMRLNVEVWKTFLTSPKAVS